MKIVLSRSAGAFSLSEAAVTKILSKHNLQNRIKNSTDLRYRQTRRQVKLSRGIVIDRDDPHLISVVEELGCDANGPNAELAVVTVPDCVDWAIGDVVGIEFVSADGKIWPTATSSGDDQR
jgi:hypothetical protein